MAFWGYGLEQVGLACSEIPIMKLPGFVLGSRCSV